MRRFTYDTLFDGALRIAQPRAGYRFSIDAVILAHSVRPKPGEKLLELGCGCGVIPLIIAFRFPETHLTGVEVQPELAQIARSNVIDNGMQDRIRILEMDMTQLDPLRIGGPVQRVVSNPPYRRAASGRLNPNPQRAVARHEIRVTSAQVIESAARMLTNGGHLHLIHTAERLPEIFTQMQTSGIEPKHLRGIQSRRTADAKRVLIRALKGGRPGIQIAPPLVVYEETGEYTEELQEMFLP